MRTTVWIGGAALALSCGGQRNNGSSSGDASDSLTASDTTSASASASTSTSAGTETAEDGSSEGGPLFDVGTMADVNGPGDCDGNGGGDLEFSHIWIANSGEDTVSKINTITVEEEGRYLVHNPAITGGSPSRTSVNLNGDMAVANRCHQIDMPDCAGVTMVAARQEDCIDRNNDNVIQTSMGMGDTLPWMEDECVLWHTPLTTRSNRPVAWTSGTFNPSTCRWEDPKVWTAHVINGDDTRAKVLLLNGADGTIEDEVILDGWTATGHGIYGGAVDSHNDFWIVGGYAALFGHVRMDDLSWEVIPGGSTPYGMMVDNQDRPWRANGTMTRYDPMTDVFDTQSCGQGCTAIAQDAEGWVWVGGATNADNKVLKVDPDTMQIVDMITSQDIPEMGNPWGLAIDVQGYIWAVEMGTKAFKIDPVTYEYWIFQNTSSMYTYSDMTGFGLKNVANPQG